MNNIISAYFIYYKMETWKKCYLYNKKSRLSNNLQYIKSFLSLDGFDFKQQIQEIELELFLIKQQLE